jgi:pyruvate dehydrogenase E1 component alpha subunit
MQRKTKGMFSASSGRPDQNLNHVFSMYRDMVRIRTLETVAIEALEKGLIFGALHPYIGQEAIAVGVCTNLRPEDVLLSTHRGHGHTLAKGADPKRMMLELFGRKGGYCKGKGGSMHIADLSVGMLGANGIVGANLQIAVGAAHAIKLRKEDKIVVCFFGDGAINRGPFLEGLNWAGTYGLPILFVCEDNAFAASTRTSTLTSGDGADARAKAMGIPSVVIDGNDVLETDRASAALVEKARRYQPQLMVARTYRMFGHTATDPGHYRPMAEVEENRKNDPVLRCRAHLVALGMDPEQLICTETDIMNEMKDAAASAAAGDWPTPEDAYADVQDIGSPVDRPFQ